MTLAPDDLVAGPRGRRLLLSLLNTAQAGEGGGLEEFGGLAEEYSYRIDEAQGTTARYGLMVSEDDDAVGDDLDADEPARRASISVSEVAAALDAAELPRFSEDEVIRALVEAVDTARYWQEPDGEDRLAAAPELRPGLIRVAEALIGASLMRGWSDPVDRANLWSIDWVDVQLPREIPLAAPGSRHQALVEHSSLMRAQTGEWSASEARRTLGSISGPWWSMPEAPMPDSSDWLPGRGPIGLWCVEDGFGWEAARVQRLLGVEQSRVWEIHTGADWAELCRRHPMDVTGLRRHDWFNVTGRDGRWLLPDWASVAREVDGVHLSIAGYLATAGRSIEVDDRHASVIAGWNPGQTWWFSETARLADEVVEWSWDDDRDTWTS